MKVYFTNLGRVKKATGSSIFKQSDNTNILQFKFDGVDRTCVVHATFLLPYGKNSGQYGQYSPESLLMTVVPDKEDTGYMWEASLGKGYLVNDGNAYLSAKIQYPDDTVKTTEMAQFIIEPSGDYVVTAVPPEQAEQILKELAKINSQLIDVKEFKQDKEDDRIENENSKSVVVNINDLNRAVKDNSAQIDIDKRNIQDLKNEVDNIKDELGTGINRVGTLEQETRPTEEELTAFTLEKEGRNPKSGDYVEWKTPNGDISNIWYKTGTGWGEPDPQAPRGKASNVQYGEIKGGLSATGILDVDIQNGEIANILVNEIPIENKILNTEKDIKGIKSGAIMVGKADLALKDRLGRDIPTSYASIDNVYSKMESDDRFAKKLTTKPLYISQDGLIVTVPTTPIDGKQFEISSGTGETLICRVECDAEIGRTYSSSSRDTTVAWIKSSVGQNMAVKVVTRYVNTAKNQDIVMGTDISGAILLQENNLTKFSIDTIYNNIENGNEIVSEVGSKFVKEIYIVNMGFPATVSLYSNEVYPSVVLINFSTILYDLNTILGKKLIDITTDRWVQEPNGKYSLTIPQTEHKQIPATTYDVSLNIEIESGIFQRYIITPIIKANGDIIITSATKPLACEVIISSVAGEAEMTNVLQKLGELEASMTSESERIDNIHDSLDGTKADSNDVQVIDLGSRRVGAEFDFDPDILNKSLFNEYPLVVRVTISNFIINLYRSDMELSKDKVYYSTTMFLGSKVYYVTLVADKTTNKAILYQKEQSVLAQVDYDNIAMIHQLNDKIVALTNRVKTLEGKVK